MIDAYRVWQVTLQVLLAMRLFRALLLAAMIFCAALALVLMVSAAHAQTCYDVSGKWDLDFCATLQRRPAVALYE